ncbi:MAG TPA: peptide chain release factor N(5)-glutamine methyltransferase [Candidatus Sulfotelmatobacter sp.]|nr:peptide chain release factor N(5)-glutamine methyltransferase [Candidatus Sulfotelmatobacter sp.]
MQLSNALSLAVARLTEKQVPSPRMNAELLLRFVLNCDRAYLFAHPERKLTGEETARYESALAKRASGVPAQYITGHQEFWGMDLIVTPDVLIPRPETEHVIEAVLEILMSDNPKLQGPRSEVRIADVGTGSGAIALALAKELPEAKIHAIDISSAALEIARANAARLQLESRIHFHEGNLLEGLTPATFDLVVSNPPYVGDSEEDQVQLEVRKFEPRNAVFAGSRGIEVIERLVPQARLALRPRGWLILEISGSIAEDVKKLLRDWEDVSLKPDLQSIPRVAQARKP